VDLINDAIVAGADAHFAGAALELNGATRAWVECETFDFPNNLALRGNRQFREYFPYRSREVDSIS